VVTLNRVKFPSPKKNQIDTLIRKEDAKNWSNLNQIIEKNQNKLVRMKLVRTFRESNKIEYRKNSELLDSSPPEPSSSSESSSKDNTSQNKSIIDFEGGEDQNKSQMIKKSMFEFISKKRGRSPKKTLQKLSIIGPSKRTTSASYGKVADKKISCFGSIINKKKDIEDYHSAADMYFANNLAVYHTSPVAQHGNENRFKKLFNLQKKEGLNNDFEDISESDSQDGDSSFVDEDLSDGSEEHKHHYSKNGAGVPPNTTNTSYREGILMFLAFA